MVVETLKEFLQPNKFSLFSYIVVILYILVGVLMAGYSASLRTREHDKFQCSFVLDTVSEKHQYLQEKCYEKYDTEYNSPLPLWGFVLLEFASVLVVCLIYSCCVQSTIARIAPSDVSDAESAQFGQRRPRRIFRCYILHLLARFGLTTLFRVLQPLSFPTDYFCGSPIAQPWNVTNSNNTNTEFKPTAPAMNCHTSIANDKTRVSIFLCVLNILCLLLVSGEIIYLIFRAFQSSNFTDDTEFRARYFFYRSSTHGVRNRMKKLILQQTDKVSLSCCKNRRFIDDIFVDLALAINVERANGELTIINSYEELYLPIENIADGPKVLVVGLPGTGKSLLCQKLLRDWSKKRSFERFDFAFLFKFSSFNSERTDKMSLKELLNRGACSEGIVENVFEQILAGPEKILLIFDGLDEFKDRQNCTKNKEAGFKNSSTEEIPVSALYVKLLQNKLLSGATVLTTSRPNVITSYEDLFGRTFEITDFTEEKVHKYVDNYCKQDGDSNIATSIKEHISATSYLLSLCCIPLYCHIVCNLLRDVFIVGSSDGVRLTDVYQQALTFFIFKHHPDHRDEPCPENHERFSEFVEKTLTDVGLLAKRGIFKNQRMFCSEEVADAIKNCGLLKKTTDENGKQCFSFIHPTFQDFLAARRIVKMKPATLKEKVIHVLKVEDADWFLVLQFVMGLLHGEPHDVVSAFVNCLLASLLSSPTNGKMALLMMKCLYEYSNEATAKEVASQLQQNNDFNRMIINLQKCQVTSSDCTAIVYFLKHFDSFELVDVRDNSIGERGYNELAKLLETGGSKKLKISNNKIVDQGLISLLKATQSTKCSLTIERSCL